MTIILKKEWEECYKSGQIPWDNFAQEELIDILKNKGFKNIKEAIGSDSN